MTYKLRVESGTNQFIVCPILFKFCEQYSKSNRNDNGLEVGLKENQPHGPSSDLVPHFPQLELEKLY